MEDKWNIFILSYSIRIPHWNGKSKLNQPHCVIPQLMQLVCYLSVPCCVPCCVSLLHFDVSAVSVISPSLSFSCFMVSPRQKYSFRSVIFNAIKKNPHATFSSPSLRSLHLLHREVVNRDGLILYLLYKTYCMFLHRAKVESKMGLQVE